MSVSRLGKSPQEVGPNRVVRIQIGDPFAPRGREPEIARPADAGVILPQIHEPPGGELLRVPFPQQDFGSIRRSIINDNQLPIGEVLPQCRVNRLADAKRPVVCRKDDGEFHFRVPRRWPE